MIVDGKPELSVPDCLVGFTYRLAAGPGPGMTYLGRRPRCVQSPAKFCEERQLGRPKPQPRIPQARIHAISMVANMSTKTDGGDPDRGSLGEGKPRGCEVPSASLPCSPCSRLQDGECFSRVLARGVVGSSEGLA